MSTIRESDSKLVGSAQMTRMHSENEITPDKAQHKSKESKTTRKRKRWRSSSSLEDEIDTTIDGELKQKASNYNLSEREVKKILTKVVKNEHVLAIVKLKEEKLDREEQAMKLNRENDHSYNSRNKTPNMSDTMIEMDDSADIVPTLTRAKAKELNTYPLPVAPIKKSDSEVAALIHEELHSDDDDEEYQPGEDDIESDDDINTTTSDIDSQPATPSSQIDMSQPRTPIYTDDGLFKIPRIRNDSTASQLEQEYSIAKQTRSKISYAETPIELIEATLNAPDVTNDMYPDVLDMDPDWTEFLFSCMNPTSAAEMEKDEEDPDYFPKTPDGQIYDREEFQLANVPKKELKTLRDDLYEWLFFSEGFDDPSTIVSNNNSKPTDPMPSTSANLNESLITPIKDIMPDPLMVNITTEDIPETDATMQSPHIQNNSASEYFNPKIISTPARSDLLCHNSDYNQYMSYPTIELPTFSNQSSFTDYNNISYLPGTELLGQQQSFNGHQPFNANAYSPFKLVTFGCPNATETSSNMFTMPPMIVSTPAVPSTIVTPTIAINFAPIFPVQEKAENIKTRLGCRSKRSRFKRASFPDLEHLDPNSITANQMTFSPNAFGFTDAQRLVLERQLRIHVQLSTQSYLQTYGHPRLYHWASQFKRNLLELKEIVETEGAKPVSIFNLKPALELIEDWENELEPDTLENTNLIEFVRDQLDKLKNNNTYKMRFHDRILHKMCTSKVFLYPDYLPSTPFQVDVKKSEYIPSEDYMIAFLLEHFFNELNAKMIQYKFAKAKIVNLTDVCKHIAAHLNYIRQPKSIYDYVRLRRKQDIMNPIKYYFTHNIAPPYQHTYELFRESMALEPAKQPASVLPSQFANYVCKLNCNEYSKELYRFNIAALTQSPKKRKGETKKSSRCTPITTKIYNKENIFNGEPVPIPGSQVKVKILYEPLIDSKCKPKEETTQFELPKGQRLLTSFFAVKRKPTTTGTSEIKNDDDFGPTESINDYHDPTEPNDRPKNLLLQRNRILRKYCKLNNGKFIVKKRLQRCLVLIIRSNKEQTTRHWRQYSHNTTLLYVYQCILIYHQFTSAILTKQFESKEKMTTDTIMINRRAQRALNEQPNNGREANDDNHLGPNIGDAAIKRLPKSQRNANDNNLLMLLTENANESTEKDYLFAQHYIDRVEETFANDNLHHKFTEFLNILRVFNENQPKQNGADLYLKLEKLFLPDHPELADIFLLFLTPSDAIEIGKFMDHFFQTNFTKFISKLNIFFQKQPAQIRKVFACVKELSEDENVSFDRIRSRILPLLKGNQLLIDWFSQCIGPDKCDGSKDEYETLDLRKSQEMEDDDGETYEYIPQNEIVSDPNDNPCHVRFINGRLFYGNRITIPAKLSFGVSPCVSPSKHPHEIDRAYLIGTRDKMHQYRCVHNIKQFGDRKMCDISKTHAEFDQMGNSVGLDEIENSDDDQPHCMLSPSDKTDEKHSFDEDTENSATYGPDQLLCDDALLRAHSIRLNPSSHAHMFPANIELLNKLKQSHSNDIASCDTNTKELKLSPKKQATLKCLTNIIQPKIAQARKNPSPNAKSIGGCKSPNGKKATTSPLSNSHPSTSSMKEPNPYESNAIQTAKKLKRMLEPHSSNLIAGQQSEPEDVQANKKVKKTQTIVKPIKKQKRLTEQDGNVEQSQIESETIQAHDTIADGEGEGGKTPPPPPPQQQQQLTETLDDRDDISPKCETKITWKSDEDRVLLEQIKNGFDFSDESIMKMAQRFPNKTSEHIRERVDFLIDFIMNRT